MRLLDRYLLREFLFWLGLVLVFGLICIIAFDLFTSLNNFQEHKLLPHDVLELYVAEIPGFLVLLLPIVLLIALLIVLTNHARHNELTAIRAAGISLWRICLPYFIVGLFLSVAIFVMNERWVPDTQARVDKIKNRRLAQSAATDPAMLANLGFPNARDNRNWFIGLYDSRHDVMLNPQVNWHENGSTWHLIARRAERIDGVWTFFGDTAFGTNDIASIDLLAARLNPQGATNAISQYIYSQLSPATQTLLRVYRSGGGSPEFARAVAEDFDRIVRAGPLYESGRFAGVKLQPDTEALLARNPSGAMLLELNRLLLLDAFPRELSRNGLNTVSVFKGEADNNNDYKMLPHLDTNILAMPQFTETPAEFFNEAKFNSRFLKLSANAAEVPIAELLDYAKLHPDMSRQRRAWLLTQLHSRLALPWACIVVVVIAIPFGAPSGRRNIFMGVAGSIVICFAYIILLRLGLALGTSGLVPAWIAAWLPNALFGITGFWLTLRVR